jgi:Xaa-Pro aminopeptidase
MLYSTRLYGVLVGSAGVRVGRLSMVKVAGTIAVFVGSGGTGLGIGDGVGVNVRIGIGVGDGPQSPPIKQGLVAPTRPLELCSPTKHQYNPESYGEDIPEELAVTSG